MGIFFQNTSTEVVSVVAVLLSLAYFYVKYLFSYWDRHGVKSFKPSFPCGNFAPSLLMKKHMGLVIAEYYKRTSEPFFGLYGSFRPLLVVRDTELLQKILIKDFQHFTDRGVYFDEKRDPLSAHLFALSGQKWKNLRAKLSPTFTSGRLKAMFPILIGCGSSLQKYLADVAKQNTTFEVREVAAKHTTNVIASVAFGLETDCFANPDEEFRKYGRKGFEPTLKRGLIMLFRFIFPQFLVFFHIKSINSELETFVRSMVKQNLEYREKNNVTRKDFFQLLIQLRNSGTVQLDDKWDTVIKNEDQKKLTLDEMTAQAYIFFLAGFETSSTTLSFCLYELAKNPEIQQKVHEEIDQVLKKHDGQITYDSVNEMKYLECCIDETLRKYPIVPILNRECTKEYNIPNSDVVIKKHAGVIVPVYALHHDPKYYPDPEKFIPERFNEENSEGRNIVNRPFLTFGEGPRICIGMRLGHMQTKTGLILMLKDFTFQLGESLINKEMEYTPYELVIAPVNGIDLKCRPR